MNDRLGVAEFLEGMADLAATHQPIVAALLWGAAETIREEIGAPLPPTLHDSYGPHIAIIRSQLGIAAFTQAWRDGRALTQDEAVKYALASVAIQGSN